MRLNHMLCPLFLDYPWQNLQLQASRKQHKIVLAVCTNHLIRSILYAHDTDLDTQVERMQEELERDYACLEWHVLVQGAPGVAASTEPWLFVHARTRDFRYGCRIGRSQTAVLHAPTLRFLVAELVAEVERRLADRATSAS